jgi:quinolinate synthase
MNELTEKILNLKKAKNAVILAHFYEPENIQELADFVGDSLELSRYAKECKADIIIFCGVGFMAGSAKLLNPEKTVLLPKLDAGCKMADMVTAEDIKKLHKENPEAAVVIYINSSVDAKTESDICCTSSNAIKIVNSLPNKEIIFVPDRNLGAYVSRFTDKKIILFEGYCPVHDIINKNDINNARKQHPEALIVVHPECRGEVIENADYCGSTSQIISFIEKSNNTEFIVGTEKGILYTLKKKFPDKIFYMLTDNFICADMKKITPENVLESLENESFKIEFDEDTIKKATKCLDAMMSVKI